ncbi:hypothetical protein [Pedobacter duraquae]|uniref:Uncharacterized protein n=1 Tax=Pedobacter duraquae TaxID=425511 RepID=A0A4R6IMG1_9SPHI|nr:hypothetical protein [Pedobacter duraquae]TDO23364.1 hypothetical protein CLV32_2355 [Pedobacter duraquae]
MEQILKRLNFQPATLTITEMENPEQVLATFFENCPIHEVRENLWEMYKGWIYNSAEYTDPDQTRAMMSFYTELVNFVNAAFLSAEKTNGN